MATGQIVTPHAWLRRYAVTMVWQVTRTATVIDLILNPLLSLFDNFGLTNLQPDFTQLTLLFRRQDPTNTNLAQSSRANCCDLGVSYFLRALFDQGFVRIGCIQGILEGHLSQAQALMDRHLLVSIRNPNCANCRTL